MEVTIGGNRIGSGKKMQAHLHNYNRSTHNLSETFASSMTCGVLYPALCKLAMRGDSFDITINADCRTIPTVGPLFGSFKMQVDVYQCPVRLYQGILHNNPLAIGLKMQQVKFPLLEILSKDQEDHKSMQMNTSSLMHYLGLSGLGRCINNNTIVGRKINALPALSYYDIFKTYYANKQEDKAYVISAKENSRLAGTLNSEYYNIETNENDRYSDVCGNDAQKGEDFQGAPVLIKIPIMYLYELTKEGHGDDIFLALDNTEGDYYEFTFNNSWQIKNLNGIKNVKQYSDYETKEGLWWLEIELEKNNNFTQVFPYYTHYNVTKIQKLSLTQFDLSNIDDMRYDLLSHHTLGSAYEIKNDENAYLPYKALVDVDDKDVTLNNYPMNGLVVKTYQNDIFNNWLNTEWIEGENSISELTKVAIVDGAFSMDSLNFAQKQYNMLNRIATAGATYEDWQDVVYEEVKRRQIESPMFVGGMSQEVVFDEIIQNAPADVDGVTTQLGDLGGRGVLDQRTQKGGKIHIKCDEACFIIAIVSLTPRLYYTQGNEFYMTDVLSLDDMHKPPMDGIGFQDLIGERLAWWDTQINATPGTTTVNHRSKIGKLPAWIEYMTSYDRAHGDFAEDAAGYMILSRRYEMADDGTIKDATTYIDPTKYNYAFAYKDLDSQNFWVQVGFNIKARRLMSARLIPNV